MTTNRINGQQGGTDDMKDSKKIIKLIEKVTDKVDSLSDRIDEISDRVDKLSDRVDKLSDRVDKLSDRVDKMSNDMDVMKSDISDIKVRLDRVEARTTDIAMTLENHIWPSIRRVAEGHQDLDRNLHEALKITEKNEMMYVRVNYLEEQVGKIKEHINMPA